MYCSRSEVLYEAGMLDRETNKPLTGEADGSNAEFYTDKAPIVDNNYDNLINVSDVVVYVNGSVVTVSAITPGSGKISLAAAPANGADVTVDYASSSADGVMVDQFILEAMDWIDRTMQEITTVPYDYIDADPVVVPLPPTIRKICRVYAAGLLMCPEYGTQAMTTETEKEGERKIQLAERWLSEYRERIESNNQTSTGTDAPSSNEDLRLFEEYNIETGGWNLLKDADVTFNGTN